MATREQIEANRRNCLKSTGPESTEGKNQSQLNKIAHGLRADAITLPGEDSEAFAASLARWIEEWKPATEERRRLVEEAATAAWRMNRCVQLETERLTKRMEAAYDVWDARDAEAVVALFDRLATDPAATLQALETTRAGVDRLIDEWMLLEIAASEPKGWREPDAHHLRLLNLLGYTPLDDSEEAKGMGDASWRFLLASRPDLAAIDRAKPLSAALVSQVAIRLTAAASAKVKDLYQLRSTLSVDSAARDRFAELAAFQPFAEDEPFLRYEAENERIFLKCIALLSTPAPNKAKSAVRVKAPTKAKSAVVDVAPTEANLVRPVDAPTEADPAGSA